MKFSILIANYNNGHFFEQCYQSIVSQEYQNWEAVILDDASLDDSIAVIKNITGSDERFKIYKNNENKGVGFTKRKLIELATGEICGYLDPDDALLPAALQSAIDVFKKNSSAVLTYSRLMHCDHLLKPQQVFKSAMQVPNNDPCFFNCPVQINHFVCFKKEIYQTTEKMNPELKISEDQDLYLKLYEKGKVIFIDETNYLYRSHEGGISQNDHKKKSYEYWGKVIFDAMKRRNLLTINGKKIPENYTNSDEIFKLLAYQNSVSFRIKKKLKILFQSFF